MSALDRNSVAVFSHVEISEKDEFKIKCAIYHNSRQHRVHHQYDFQVEITSRFEMNSRRNNNGRRAEGRKDHPHCSWLRAEPRPVIIQNTRLIHVQHGFDLTSNCALTSLRASTQTSCIAGATNLCVNCRYVTRHREPSKVFTRQLLEPRSTREEWMDQGEL